MDDVHDLSTARHFRYGGKFSAVIWSAGGVPRITKLWTLLDYTVTAPQCSSVRERNEHGSAGYVNCSTILNLLLRVQLTMSIYELFKIQIFHMLQLPGDAWISPQQHLGLRSRGKNFLALKTEEKKNF